MGLEEDLELKWQIAKLSVFFFLLSAVDLSGGVSFLASSLKAAHLPNFSKKEKFVYRDLLPKTHTLQNLTSVPFLSSLYIPKAT